MASEGLVATLQHAWKALAPFNVPMAVVGGLALSAWNHARYTRDVDLLISVDAKQVDDIVHAMSRAGFWPRHEPPIRQIDDQRIIQLRFQPPESLMPYQLDLLLADSTCQRQALERSVSQRIPDVDENLMVLRPDDLILLKLMAGRIIDLADAAMLLRENRELIDLPYMQEWIEQLGMRTQFDEIWQEAFGAEPPNADP